MRQEITEPPAAARCPARQTHPFAQAKSKRLEAGTGSEAPNAHGPAVGGNPSNRQIAGDSRAGFRLNWRTVAQHCVVVSALLFSSAPSVATPRAPGKQSLDAYARPGILVKSDRTRNINIRCSGRNGPTIILTAGAGDQSLAWHAIQASLSRGGRVCAWDRAGTGFSDPSADEQDVAHRTDDLERALAGARIAPPYILVGHSIGSFETLMFAFRHPGQVAGIVLVDPSGPNQNERIARSAPALWAVLDSYQQAQVAELAKCVDGAGTSPIITDPKCLASVPEEYTGKLRQSLSRMAQQTGGMRNQLSMLNAMFSGRDSAQLLAAWHPLGDIPLIVLTAGMPPRLPVSGAAADDVPKMQAEWKHIHDDIAGLSTRGVNRVVDGASHYIYVDRPKVVIDAIDEVLATARSRIARK